MTETTNPQPEQCPGCQHPQHQPGTECEAAIDHGPKRWHRCLCLNRPNASRPCSPLMDCQGGELGYGDIWYLQQGRSLKSANGIVTPDVLTEPPAAAVPSAPADRAALCHDAAERITAYAADHFPDEYDEYADRLADEVRRMADEAPAPSRADDEPPPETEAHPARHRWYIEILDGDGWDLTSRFHAERAAAVRDLDRRNDAAPQWSDGNPVDRRLVRETTTHTVEPTGAKEA